MAFQEALQECIKLYQKHKEEVVVGRRTGEELLQAAKAFVDLEPVAPEDYFPSSSLQYWKEEWGRDLSLGGKPPELRAFRLKRTQRNRDYFLERDGTLTQEDLAFLLELHTGRFSANRFPLCGRLCRARGISQADLDAKGVEFFDYMTTSFPDDPENPVNTAPVDPNKILAFGGEKIDDEAILENL